ncbi:PadR family transcriptional regulator [Lapillicoccus sp.]|uniref:PadR family transcriptional regulator n=1 Tax=Lapillicoccus sp. TaxID=1909287 RepID=UPI0032670003
MSTYLRQTPALRDVLCILLDAHEETWGLRVSAASGRPTGTVYPLLERLERAKFVASRWDIERDGPGPRRRLYALTEEGRAWAQSKGLSSTPTTSRGKS